MGNTNLKRALCGHALLKFNLKRSVVHVQGSLNLTFAHTGKFGQILCYTCDVVRMVHKQHDGQGVEWSRCGQYHLRMVIVRARTVKIWAIPN